MWYNSFLQTLAGCGPPAPCFCTVVLIAICNRVLATPKWRHRDATLQLVTGPTEECITAIFGPRSGDVMAAPAAHASHVEPAGAEKPGYWPFTSFNRNVAADVTPPGLER